MKRTGGLTVGDVAERSGIAVSAVHFYERKGLITSERNEANHRRYSATVLRRIAIIQVAQRVGIPLREIADAMDFLPSDTKVTVKDWEKLSTRWTADLDDRIARLQRLRDGMAGCIGCGCLSMDSCHLVNPGDQIGANGPGPRYLEEDAP
ncbi:redox-sensitive transcriptional activator SoxR [Tropicibacter sp. R16_0]|uniref:redox-sensitive transcriptional activator SoxR n=1 Tax=Tropicibacter sp. R16_0 TaxID=2821102 RepID=UPI001ADB9244|nr:redox-sensitive transcriptional activator SoxR [Tropicibacter sp. R16_0]MBO9452050.1 redox-sensitive transcriptional activator SoxR [Tropicibacter sp. R16_0]